MGMPNRHRSRYDILKDLISETDPPDDPAAIDVPGRILQLSMLDDTVAMIKKWLSAKASRLFAAGV